MDTMGFRASFIQFRNLNCFTFSPKLFHITFAFGIWWGDLLDGGVFHVGCGLSFSGATWPFYDSFFWCFFLKNNLSPNVQKVCSGKIDARFLSTFETLPVSVWFLAFPNWVQTSTGYLSTWGIIPSLVRGFHGPILIVFVPNSVDWTPSKWPKFMAYNWGVIRSLLNQVLGWSSKMSRTPAIQTSWDALNIAEGALQ